MPKRVTLLPHHSTSELEQRYRRAHEPHQPEPVLELSVGTFVPTFWGSQHPYVSGCFN